MESKEEWKTINGYQFYQVSNLGRVRRLKNRKGKSISIKILSPSKNKYGYYRVVLRENKKSVSFYVHRLVAHAFIPNPYKKPHINHIDNNPQNNRADNLEWCTPVENMEWKKKCGRTIISNAAIKNMQKANEERAKPIVGINDMDGKTIHIKSINSSKYYGFTPQLIFKCCIGERKHHKGYRWEYEKIKKRSDG